MFILLGFWNCSDREYQRGDEVAWYPDGDTMVRHDYNPLTAYAFGILRFFFIFFLLDDNYFSNWLQLLVNIIPNFWMLDKVFGPQANTMDVYDVAARPVVKAAMEGVNGMELPHFFSYI